MHTAAPSRKIVPRTTGPRMTVPASAEKPVVPEAQPRGVQRNVDALLGGRCTPPPPCRTALSSRRPAWPPRSERERIVPLSVAQVHAVADAALRQDLCAQPTHTPGTSFGHRNLARATLPTG